MFYSCAQRVAITGGAKDISPPELKNSVPDTFSTHFKTNKIKLEFNEFVQVNNVSKNLLITPVFQNDPVVIAVGKTVIIKNIEDSLWPNTTYVIEFNEAIKDITENNPAKGFRYVFSTGDYVDSLSVSGLIIDAFTLEAVEDVFVFMYESNDDSIPYIEIPRYMGRTDKSGQFRINNMKAGKYKAFMCTDDNGNYLLDPDFERYDFLDNPVEVDIDSNEQILGRIFQENVEIQYLKGFGSVNDWSFYLSYNLPLDTLVTEPLVFGDTNLKKFRIEYNEERDSVVFWAPDTLAKLDSIYFRAETDTLPWDSLDITFYKEKRPKKLKRIDNLSKGKLNLGENLIISFNFPLIVLDTSKISLISDSAVIPIEIVKSDIDKTIEIIADWQEEKKYNLILDSACFIDMYGLANDSTVQSFDTYERNYYGTLEITLDIRDEESGILQILDGKDKIVKEVYLRGINGHYFEYVHPGEYKLKFILDQNKNGRWDAGKYLQHIHAETVKIYQGKIKIRSNWDQTIEWKFD